MEPPAYTLARYRVKPGQEDAFVAAWNALADSFGSLPAAPIWGALVRSQTEPEVYYSFGPWRSDADIKAMRSDPRARDAFARISEHCVEMAPGDFDLVRRVVVEA